MSLSSNVGRSSGIPSIIGKDLRLNGELDIYGQTTSSVPLTIHGANGQTANIIEAKNYAGTVLFSLDPSGNVTWLGDEYITDQLSVNGNASITGSTAMTGAVTMAGGLHITSVGINVVGSSYMTNAIIKSLTIMDEIVVEGSGLHLNDNIVVSFGNTTATPDAGIAWNTTQTVDALYIGLSAAQNTMIIGEYADRTYDFAHDAQTNPTLYVQSANQSATEFAKLNAGVLTFGLGIATVAGQYSIGRNADATNVMNFNVPTGATYEWGINDVAQLTLSASTLAVASPIALTTYAHGILPNGFLYFDNVDATGSGFYNGTNSGQMNFWLGSIHGRALCFSNGDIRGADFDHALQPYATIFLQGSSNPEVDNRQYVNWYNDGSNSYHLTGIGGHRFGFEAIQANAILTFTANPTTNLGVVFTVNTGTLTGTTAAPGANQFQLLGTLALTLASLVTNWNLIAGTGVVAHVYGNTVVFEASATGTTANAYVTTETTDTDNVYRFQGAMSFTANPTTTSGIVFTVGTGTLTGVTGTPGANQFQIQSTLSGTLQALVTAYNTLAVGVYAVYDYDATTNTGNIYFDGGTTGVSIFTETTDTDVVYSFTATTAGSSTTMFGGRAFSAFMDMQPTYMKLTKQGTATAGVTTYNSQALGLIGSGWDTDDTIARDVEIRNYVTPSSGASVGITTYWDFYRAGVFVNNAMNLTGGGAVTFGNAIYSNAGGGQFTLGATDSLTINSSTTDRTSNNALQVNVDTNSATVAGIGVTGRVGTALSATEQLAGMTIDMDGVAGDSATSIVDGIYLTSTNTSGGYTNAIEVAGAWDWGVVLKEQGTATALAPEYNSNNLSLRASAWNTTTVAPDYFSWRIYNDAATGATGSTNGKLSFDVYLNGGVSASRLVLSYDSLNSMSGTLTLTTTTTAFLALGTYGTSDAIIYYNKTLGQFIIGAGSNVGNATTFGVNAYAQQDYDHALQTNPTAFFQDATSPNVTNNLYGSATHNGTNFVISAGENTGAGTVPVTANNGILIAPQALTAGGTADYAVSITRTLNDAGAAGGSDLFNGLLVNVIPTNVTGWNTLNLFDWQYNTVSVFKLSTLGLFVHTPTTTGTLYDIALETEWTTGIIFNADFGGATTLTGDVTGFLVDGKTNVTGVQDGNFTGYKVLTPALTQATTATTEYIGFSLYGSGALVQNTLVGTIDWFGLYAQMPNITQTTGAVTSYGIYLAGGTVTSGTQWGLFTTGTSNKFVLGASNTFLIDATGAAGLDLNITSTSYTTLLGGIDVVRSGAITGVNGEIMIDMNIAPAFTLTEPGAGIFYYRGLSVDMASVAVTAGAGTTGLVCLYLNAATDADIGSSHALYAIGSSVINGNVGIGALPFSWGANSVNVFGIYNGTAPAAAVANEIQIYSIDSSDATATLGLMLEQAVEAIGTFTASHKIKVLLNGTEYYLSLDSVA